MGLNATITHAIAGTLASSSQYNTNLDNLNNAMNPNFARVALTVGSFARFSIFSGTGSGTFSHGLGKIPDVVMMISTSSGNPQSFEYHSATSSQVTITASGTSQSWIAIAIAQTA